MTALYIIGGMAFFLGGFACGVMLCALRMSAIMDKVADEALKVKGRGL